MKTLRNLALIMLAIVAFLIMTQPAQAQSLEVRSLLSDRGWHTLGNSGVQAHQPTLEFRAPWVSVWERSPRSDRYGDWTYIQVVFNCQRWSHVPIATLSDDWSVTYLEDLTGEAPAPRWPDPGTTPYNVMTAVCGLYGYTRQPVPQLRPNPDGAPYVGSIKRLDKP